MAGNLPSVSRPLKGVVKWQNIYQVCPSPERGLDTLGRFPVIFKKVATSCDIMSQIPF